MNLIIPFLSSPIVNRLITHLLNSSISTNVIPDFFSKSKDMDSMRHKWNRVLYCNEEKSKWEMKGQYMNERSLLPNLNNILISLYCKL